jgi:hypothetical protein
MESCIGAVVTQGEACATSCVTVAAPAATACLVQPVPLMCLAGVGQQLGQCAQSCEGAALASGEVCKESYLGCQQQCGP